MSLSSVDAAVVRPIMVDQLYKEATALADESRTYFATFSKTDRAALGAIDRVLYTAESLRISTRLMHVISWAMVRKAVAHGELTQEESMSDRHHLDDVELCRSSSPRDLRQLPRAVAVLSHKSLGIFERALRMQEQMLAATVDAQSDAQDNPVANMLKELELAI